MSPTALENYILRVDNRLRQLLEELPSPAQRFNEAMAYSLFPGGKRLRPVLCYLTGHMLGMAPDTLDEAVFEARDGEVHIFADLKLPIDYPDLLSSSMNLEEPIIIANSFRQHLATVERYCGMKEKLANAVVAELLGDFKLATRYPPDILDDEQAFVLADMTHNLIGRIQRERESAAENAD